MKTTATTSLLALTTLLVTSGPGLAQEDPAAVEDPAAHEHATEDVAPAAAQEENVNVGIVSEDLIPATSTNVLGEPITYPTGTPEIASWTATFEKGGRSMIHQHPVPMYVHVLEGELEVQLEGDESFRIAAGESIIEPQNRTMQAFNVADGPTKILVVAMTVQGQPSGVPVDE